MHDGLVADLLARTATHQVEAWRALVAAGGLAAFGVLFLKRSAASAQARAERSRRAALAVSLGAGVLGAALGATLLPILLRLPATIAERKLAPLLVGDRMAIGALVGFALGAALAARRLTLDPARTLDRLAPSLGLLVLFGRLGCFLEGCDFGAVTGVPWAVRYPAGSHAWSHHLATGLVHATDAASLPVHPAQLYDAAVGLAMIGVALWAGWQWQRRRGLSATALQGTGAPPMVTAPPMALVQDGAAFRAVIATYAVGRFVVELYRGDVRGALGPLSLPQWMCVALLAWVVAATLGERAPADQRR